MKKPPPMKHVADPPELWQGIVDELCECLQRMSRRPDSCPPWSGLDDNACPVPPGENVWCGAQCWLLWAYTLTVIRMTTTGVRRLATNIARWCSDESVPAE